jgi:DNA-binding CsgD family transcriptional regulator
VRNCLPVLAADLVRLSMAVGDQSGADRVVVEVQTASESCPLDWLQALELRCRGHRERDAGLMADAAVMYASTPRRLDEAQTWHEVAQLSTGEESRRARERAKERYTVLGALGSLAALADHTGDAIDPVIEGWGSLTRTESAIAALVGEGHTNAQIAHQRGVSTRTVESHLHRVYRKLNIDSRARLVLDAAQHYGPSR